jgi:hypothetical protein
MGGGLSAALHRRPCPPEFTQPTSLRLSARSSEGGKEGEGIFYILFFLPSFLLAKERVGQRSVAGVSRLCPLPYSQSSPSFIPLSFLKSTRFTKTNVYTFTSINITQQTKNNESL